MDVTPRWLVVLAGNCLLQVSKPLPLVRIDGLYQGITCDHHAHYHGLMQLVVARKQCFSRLILQEATVSFVTLPEQLFIHAPRFNQMHGWFPQWETIY